MRSYNYFIFFLFYDSNGLVSGQGNCEFKSNNPILSLKDLNIARDEISKNNDNRVVLIHSFQLFGDK